MSAGTWVPVCGMEISSGAVPWWKHWAMAASWSALFCQKSECSHPQAPCSNAFAGQDKALLRDLV